MDHKRYNGLLKNPSKAIELASSDPNLPLTVAQRNELIERIENYEPDLNSDAHRLKSKALSVLITSEVISNTTTSLGEDLAAKSCILEIHVRQPGFRKRINSAHFVAVMGNGGKVSTDTLNVTQEVINLKSIGYLEDQRTTFLDKIKSYKIPVGALTPGNGQHLILVSNVEEIQSLIEEFKSQRQILLDRFEASYSDLIEYAKTKRGAFFHMGDYPPFSEIRAKYRTEYKFISNSIPMELKKISDQLYQRESQRVKSLCDSAVSELRDAMRLSFQALIHDLASKLGVDEFSGRLKRLDSKKVQDLVDFIDRFNSLDFSKDVKLKAVMDETKEVLNGFQGEWKHGLEFRTDMQRIFEGISGKLSEFIEEAPARSFDI